MCVVVFKSIFSDLCLHSSTRLQTSLVSCPKWSTGRTLDRRKDRRNAPPQHGVQQSFLLPPFLLLPALLTYNSTCPHPGPICHHGDRNWRWPVHCPQHNGQPDNSHLCGDHPEHSFRDRAVHSHQWWRYRWRGCPSDRWDSLPGLLWCDGPMGPTVQLQCRCISVLLRYLLLPLLLPVSPAAARPEHLLQLWYAHLGQHWQAGGYHHRGPGGPGPGPHTTHRLHHLRCGGHNGSSRHLHQTGPGEEPRRKWRRSGAHWPQLQVRSMRSVLRPIRAFHIWLSASVCVT